MDKLKQYIDDHREAFDAAWLPEEGHAQRFEKKLRQQEKRFRLPVSMIWIAAATIALLIALTWNLCRPEPLPETAVTAGNDPVHSEIQTLCRYYEMEMKELYVRIQTADAGNNSEEKERIVEESHRILANNKQFEKEVIPKLPDVPQTVYALMDYYSIYLERLHFMLQQIEDTHNNY